ncbi:MAG: HNH endonuclease [Dehalococcoidales bacterium]
MNIGEWLSFIKLTPTSWPRVVAIVKKRDKCICQYCGRFDEKGEVDHVLPLSRGGTDAFTNLVWACRPCNRSKGDKTVREWVRYLAQRDREDIFAGIIDFTDTVREWERVYLLPYSPEDEYVHRVRMIEAIAKSVAVMMKSLELAGYSKSVLVEFESKHLALTGVVDSGEDLTGSSLAKEAEERGQYVSEALADEAVHERLAGYPGMELLHKASDVASNNGNGRKNACGGSDGENHSGSAPRKQGRLL